MSKKTKKELEMEKSVSKMMDNMVKEEEVFSKKLKLVAFHIK